MTSDDSVKTTNELKCRISEKKNEFILILKFMKKSSQRLQDLMTNFLLIQGILGHPLFCVHIDDKTKDVRYGLLGISFDSKKAEIRSIIDNLPDTSYLYNIPKSGWTKKVSVTLIVELDSGGS